MQVAAATVGNLARSDNFVMMVKRLGGKEMKLSGEQHTHNQGVHPETESRFSTAPHLADCAQS